MWIGLSLMLLTLSHPPHTPTPFQLTPLTLTLHCCSSSSMMWITEEGPPRDPNRSRPSKASRAAWHNRRPHTRSGLNQQSYNSNESFLPSRWTRSMYVQYMKCEKWKHKKNTVTMQGYYWSIRNIPKLTIPASLAASPHDYRVWSSPWPCRWNWHSAPVLRCLSCLHAPKYHSPSYMWEGRGEGQ